MTLLLWFVLVLVLFVGFAIAEVFWPLTLLLVVGVAATWFFTSFSFASLAFLLHPLYIGLYIVLGIFWVFFRWTKLVEKKLKQRKKDKARHPDAPSRWEDVPKWSDHQWGFLAYFFYWPIDMVAYVLSDLLRDIWNIVSRLVGQVFDRYAEWRFSNLDQ